MTDTMSGEESDLGARGKGANSNRRAREAPGLFVVSIQCKLYHKEKLGSPFLGLRVFYRALSKSNFIQSENYILNLHKCEIVEVVKTTSTNHTD